MPVFKERYNSNRRDITRFTILGLPWTTAIPPGYEQIVTGLAQHGDLSYRTDVQGFLPLEDPWIEQLTPADFFYCTVRRVKETKDVKEAPDG